MTALPTMGYHRRTFPKLARAAAHERHPPPPDEPITWPAGAAGMFAVCSARREVLEAAIALARDHGEPLLVEATANQVNQFGGYTGMTPRQFASSSGRHGRRHGLPAGKPAAGGRSPGAVRVAKRAGRPRPWPRQPSWPANAWQPVSTNCTWTPAFGCSDDPPQGLPLEIAAERTAALCQAAETAAERLSGRRQRPLLCHRRRGPDSGRHLGEPGGDPGHAGRGTWLKFIALTESRFQEAGLSGGVGAAARGDRPARRRVRKFQRRPLRARKGPRALGLSSESAGDHDLRDSLHRLPDARVPGTHGRAIISSLLKAGPCLTNAFREAVFALEEIEAEHLKSRRGAVPVRRPAACWSA
ncbi:MAG: class II D-tagatose-bisphosphate aldolase, non-catalytic subunit [Desulfobacterales bacterium]|nr:class II D-tagatose-bisphosphate aldolase, non-catalytic subunit [Desulfobacterales bacterium]